MAKGLAKGKGLEAILGDDTVNIEPNEFESLPISRVEPRRGQPRTNFDEKALAELAASIEAHGVLQPLTVRRIDGGYYQIIAGERRWRAARMAGLTYIPAKIIEADDKKATELAMVENLQREGLDPVEEARGYKTLMEEFGLTQEQVAQRVSKSRPVVANALRLLKLPERALALLSDGTLSPGVARALAGIKDETLVEDALDTVLRKNLNARQAEQLVKTLNSRKKRPPEPVKTGISVDYYAEAARLIERSMGRKTKIVHGRKKGRVEIEYNDLDDLNALIALLTEKRK